MISAPLIEYLKKGIFTLLGLILAVYLFVILMTYTSNDPSWSHISSDMTTINNVGGESGAWLSDLLYSFFGFGAWWLLAFVVYESILIWWDNKPTFWLMRVVAYVFLLLSASALFAQLVALVQQLTNPGTLGLESVAGGIIGFELQARLAQLLSQWGSVIFLTAFVIITATFAFNIHWLAIYEKVKALSWLGSGVKRQGRKHDGVSTTLENINAKQNDENIVKNNVKKDTADHEQLPLELQVAGNAQAVDNSGRFSNVLSEFLATSGLAESVKASVVAATQAAMPNSAAKSSRENSESVPVSVETPSSTVQNLVSHTNTSTPSSPAMTGIRKVEPSFTWNDANTVDDLLASEQVAYQANNMNTSDSAATTSVSADSNTESLETAVLDSTGISAVEMSEAQSTENLQSTAQPSINELVYGETADETDNEPKSFELEDKVEAVDILADAWLAEHADVSTSTAMQPAETVQAANRTELPRQAAVTAPATDSSNSKMNDFTDKWFDEEPELSEDFETSSVSNEASVAKAVDVVEPVASVADMTPTNTPPSNPKLPPTVETRVTASGIEPMVAPKPTVSFAVPEGDSSNHITDMMPEDDSAEDVNAPFMPDISDDAAFSQKSRSMQTAAYRSSLTPIPEISILDKPDPDRKPSYTVAELEQLSELLEIKLQEFNVKANVVNAIPGPVVTRFEVELAAGVKASKVTGISRDLARSLSMASLRVVEVIPGKPYIGIEVPNKQREMVRLIELLNTEKFQDPKAQISMAMGKDIGGNAIITDLARAPHMLVAGTTGSGKSVLVNSMLLSMLLKYTPNELRLILIDPKQLELANYNDIPHLLTPVVTDMTEAASALSWCVAEMERRYQLMSLLKVRKLNEFNKKVIAAEKSGNPMLDPLWRPNDSVSISQAPKLKTLPMIVIVADEFADMIMQVGKQAEELITRLAQKSRAAGIHLMLATQRPSVDVITGLIKANIPVRAALRVNSKVDSRTILDSGGAEDMLGNGDMLFLGPGQIEPDRVHGAYVSDEEVNRVCDAWRERGAPDYIDNMAGNFELSSPSGGGSTANASGEDDDLYNDAVAFIMETRKVSASSIQRKFSIGYNRAARIVDSMEDAGLVSSMGKSGKRELLM
ncbi:MULTISPECIES: DNA translocase FtsK 4TM domain-containing protein [unclassified Psychrobacter]|uniref:DNA translocase FtsK 4TM domain-containing protein n=1 Tax=unclassified Psychrobacter TaxID=196806 RepID=UPI000EB8A393|nr:MULTISPECIES: DNA translocase FtsK 4TM domain-containing protein [unclassified Psychrobacter]MBE8609405.1 DNA translocase FtsK 4TM domain-containing protein [Pseudomonas lundensis]HCI74893.1 DNA translocase FtsK [Psychrobacter sp.]